MTTADLSTRTQHPVHYKTIRVGDQRVFYREAGPKDAPAILLLHGFPTSSHMFRNLIPRLAGAFHLVAPDYPGFGQSSMPARDEVRLHLRQPANMVDQFTEQVGLKKYSLYVKDYGAPVGYRLAVKHPERVQALIVQNGNAYDEGLTRLLEADQDVLGGPLRQERQALHVLLDPEVDAVAVQERRPQRHAIEPDHLAHRPGRLDRPGNREIQLDLFHSYGRTCRSIPKCQEFFRSTSRRR